MDRFWSHAIVAATLAGAVGVSTVAAQSAGRGGLQVFDQRIAAYAELHQRVDAVFPPWAPTDAYVLLRRRAHLGAAIRAERAQAQQGEIFDAATAAALRDVVADALRGVDVELLLVDLYEGCEMPTGYRPEVNRSYPDWATHQMPTAMLVALPALPTGIQYRLIDHDLLLWDIEADLIVDVLPDALPRAGS